MFKNIVANYFGRIWSVVSIFFFVPFYIKLLGIEAYAIINLNTIILTIVFFADVGLSASVNREMSKADNVMYKGRLVATFERVYLYICLGLCTLLVLSSRFIAEHWLASKGIEVAVLSRYLILIGLSSIMQLYSSLYFSGLMGLEKQVTSNFIQVFGNLMKSGIVLIPIYLLPTLDTFFAWQIFSVVLMLLLSRRSLWKCLGDNAERSFDVSILRKVRAFAGGMFAMSIISAINTQLDKLLISKFLTLKQLGYYSVASVFSQAPVLLITPLALAVLPKIVKYTNKGDHQYLKRIYHENALVIGTIAAIVCCSQFTYASEFLLIWTKDSSIASEAANVARILVIGSFFLALQYMPYYLAVGNAFIRYNLAFGFISTFIMIPSSILLIKHLGLLGACTPWLVLNFFGFIILGFFLMNKYMRGEFKQWIIFDSLIPLIVTSILTLIIYRVTYYWPKGYWVILYSALLAISSILVNLTIVILFRPQISAHYASLHKNAFHPHSNKGSV